MDGDGDLDIVWANLREPNKLYVNDGKGRFTDVTASRMPPDRDVTEDVALGDVDGDGDLDVFVGNRPTSGILPNKLYVNDGKGRFTDVTASHMPRIPGRTFALALGDVDGDGDLDAVLGRSGDHSGERNGLYLNDGKGRFTDASSRVYLTWGMTWAVALGDVDGDGDLDVYWANVLLPPPSGVGPDELYLNDGKGRFTDGTAARLPRDNRATTAAVFGDVDGDGDLDLVCARAGSSKRNTLYVNLLRQVDSPGVAKLGFPYGLNLYAKPGFASAGQLIAPYFHFLEARPPIRIPPFGTWRLAVNGLVGLPPLPVPAPAGKLTLTSTIPRLPALAGQTLYTQAVVLHQTSPPVLRFTNVNADRILR